MFRAVLILFVICLNLPVASNGQAKQTRAAAEPEPRSITVITQPGAVVWIDSVLFGPVGADGRLTIRAVPPGNRTLRVLRAGSKEARRPIRAGGGAMSVPVGPAAGPAELALQEAEALATTDRQKAIRAFQNAISLQPKFPEAYLGLARVLSESGDLEGARATIRDLKKIKPGFADASAVEGRIYKDLGDETAAVAAFKRAIAEGGNFQPEAYTGLGLLYKEKAENAASAGDYAEETKNYDESVRYLEKAVTQLAAAPDAAVVYQLIGLIYERQKKFGDAIRVYEQFLRLFPDAAEATAVRSFITQIRKQLSEPQ